MSPWSVKKWSRGWFWEGNCLSVCATCWNETGQQVKSRWFCNICPQQNCRDERISFSQRQWTSHRTHGGSTRSIKDLLGCSLRKQRKREKLLPHIEKERRKNVPGFYSPVWSLICRHRFKLRIKSPWGPEPTCSPYPFVQTSTKDIRKRFELWVPRGPNLPISPLAFFFFIPPLTFSAPLSSPLSVSLWLFFFIFPLNLHLPPIPHCKGVFCTALMERLLSNKDRSHCGTATTNRIFCGQSEVLFHHRQRERKKKGKERKKESWSQIYPSQHLQFSKESWVCVL